MSEFDPSEYVTIPEGWSCKRLADCTIDGNISYGIVQPGQHDENGIPVIRVNNVNSGQLDLNDVLKVSPVVEKKYERTRLKGGEVLLTLVGSTGQSFVAPEELAGWNVPRAIAVIRADEEIGADWINICLQSKETMHFLNVRANTTVQKTLNLKDVRDIPILIPPNDVKESIENMALSLSEKIELNRQTNQTLEHIAQAIFKSWFVDFEPTHAKIAAKKRWQAINEITETSSPTCYAEELDSGNQNTNLRNQSLDDAMTQAAMAAISGKPIEELEQLSPEQQQQLKEIAGLFPGALVESELGKVPEGWEAGTLNDICSLNKLSWTKKNAPDEVWYVDLANTKNGVIENMQYYFWEEAPSRAKRVLSEGDTIVGTVRPGNRSFSFIGKADKQLTASTGFAVLTPKNAEYTEFVFLAATSDENIDRLAHLADGGAYPAVRPDVVTAMELILPADAVVTAFNRITKALFDKRDMNLSSECILEKLRDSLLPKLLSGELSVEAPQMDLGAEKCAI